MKLSSSLLCVIALAGIFGGNAEKMEVTPVRKVLQLLQGMLEKAKKEKHEEQVTFSESRQFCTDGEESKSVAIKSETKKIETLDAAIEKDSADAEHLLKLIGLLDSDEDRWSGDITAAQNVRKIESADYAKTHKDYTESIDAITHAISVLKKQSYDRGQKKKGSLVQLSHLRSSSLVPDTAKHTIDFFLQQDDAQAGAPEANAYEFQSSGVIDMLSKLQDKFLGERQKIEKEETNRKHAYKMLLTDMQAQIKQAIKDKGIKTSSRTKRLASAASEKADEKEEKDQQAIDSKSLKDLKANCEMKASDYEARQELRAGEIKAIEKAVEIIGGNAVSGGAEKHLPKLMQTTGASFSQLRSTVESTLANALQRRVSAFLQSQATKMNSRVLAAVALRTAADPFKKVKKMLKDLVVRLMEEANNESGKKGYCDKELATNKATRTSKTEAVETLQAEIDSVSASISKLQEDTKTLAGQVADLDELMAKATKQRVDEKAKNKATIKDSQEAQTAVAQALTVLREFYAKAAEATSFMESDDDAPYKGMQDESGGVVGMLEVIQSDFARLEAETTTAEESAQKKYEETMADSKVDKAAKSTAQEHKAAKMQDQKTTLVSKKSDLEGTQKELDASLKYYEKLKPSCVDSGVSYEDRVKRRQDEIESLQEGLKILSGEDLA